MLFPHLTIQQLGVDGAWQEDDRYLRFIGTITSAAPFVMLSLLNCGDTYHYMKHNKSDALDVSLELYQAKFPHDNRYQHSLMIGHSVNVSTVSEGRLYLVADLPITFQTGRVFTFAVDAQQQPVICLLAIAKVDIKSMRNRIWALKPQLRNGLDVSWLPVLSRTRHGVIRLRIP